MGVWETMRGELATADGHEFERKVLPLLRLFQPEMIHPTQLKTHDRSGIDFLVWSDDSKFPWVVQCKGFKEEIIGKSQLRQILASIRKFASSSYSCDKYVLLHNRTSQNREASLAIEEALAGLVKIGKAGAALMWDRQKFSDQLHERLTDLIIANIQSDAARTLRQHEALFRFGELYLPVVPVSEQKVIIRRGERMLLEKMANPAEDVPISERIIAPIKSRWTLLTGSFGTGKTTTVLHAAKLTGHQIIYVRAEAMTERGPGIGTNAMLGRVADAMCLFDEYDDQTKAIAERLVGRTLAETLRRGNTRFALVIDGLDENRLYGRPGGLIQLTNELAELTCPIILTTRREHFDSVRSNFERAFEDLSLKTGARKDARLLDLEMWTDREIKEFVVGAVRLASKEEARHLRRLIEGIDNGELRQLYGDLPTHPLFLQMILDDAAEGRIEKRNRAELVRDWMEQKIRRDLKSSRETPVDIVDIDTFIEQMMRLHEGTSSAMVEYQDGAWLLTEEISSDFIIGTARDIFGNPNIDISTILGCSVLSAVTPRIRGVMPIKFLLRVCQEFFLASALHHKGRRPDDYPEAVMDFWNDLESSNFHAA